VRNAITCALVATLSSVVQAAGGNTPALAQHIRVRVYDAGMMPAADQTVALRAAAGVLAAAGIDTTWTPCPSTPLGARGGGATCDTPLEPEELSVRFVRLPGTPSASGQLQLGYSLVDTSAHEGKLATIFVDRVEWLAGQAGADAPAVLGFALAHEIGHLLLGTNTHGTSGIMRALWSRSELQHANAKDWVFSRDEAARMRASLDRRKGLRFTERDATGCTAARDGDPDASTGCRPTASAAALRGVAAGGDR
jgi:hypothetical protein